MKPGFVPNELRLLLYWITERESVRQAKEAGEPKPWTADLVIRDHRWCNVRRMDDKVSRWLLNKWYDDEADTTTDVVAALLARLINWPDSLEEVLRAAGAKRFSLACLPIVRPALMERAKRGEKVFTGAYVVPGVPGQNKVDSVMALVDTVHKAAKGEWILAGMENCWARLIEFDGLGSFLAGQVVADMGYLRSGIAWNDCVTWAPVGPGSARGINRLLGRKKELTVRQAEFDQLLPAVMHEVRTALPDLWADRKLIAMDIQNCLCEFDKYRRLQLGEGQVRSKYDGMPPPSSLFS